VHFVLYFIPKSHALVIFETLSLGLLFHSFFFSIPYFRLSNVQVMLRQVSTFKELLVVQSFLFFFHHSNFAQVGYVAVFQTS
jgi:hypothetical protein